MTLWNIIRDFFVQHIFGGLLSNGDFVSSNVVGQVTNKDYSLFDTGTSLSLYLPINNSIWSENYEWGNGAWISLGDWLSTTFTIITLILLVVFLYIFVKWIFKLFAGLLR